MSRMKIYSSGARSTKCSQYREYSFPATAQECWVSGLQQHRLKRKLFAHGKGGNNNVGIIEWKENSGMKPGCAHVIKQDV
eukprot:IDg5262t1